MSMKYFTRSQARRQRSVSLPPQPSPRQVASVDHVVVSGTDHVLSDRDGNSPLSSDGSHEVHAQSAPLDSGALPSNFREGEEVSIQSGSQVSDIRDGSHDPITSIDPFEEGFTRPKRYASSIRCNTSNTSISSNERIFPPWFANENPEESKSSFNWSESSPDDDLPDIEDLHLFFGHRPENERSLPEIEPYTSLEVDLAHLLKDSEENRILEFRMSKVTDVRDENYSSESDNSRNKSRRRRGLRKRPPRTRQFVQLDLNGISLNGISLGDKNEPVPTAGPSQTTGVHAESDNPSEPKIPYLEKGKWRAAPEDEAEVENDELDSVRRAQIQADYEAAVELENNLLLESQQEDEISRGHNEIRRNESKHQTSKDLVEAENRKLKRQLEGLLSKKM